MQHVCNFRPPLFQHCHVPLDDNPSEDLLGKLSSALAFIQDSLNSGGKVYVHCVAGISRSASVVIAYFVQYHSMSLHAAFKFVEERRPLIRPNPGFCDQLVIFEKQVTGASTFDAVKYKEESFLLAVEGDVSNRDVALEALRRADYDFQVAINELFSA